MAPDASSAPQGKMTAEQFTYWLQGFVELSDGTPPTKDQWSRIEEHLQLVFTKVTGPSKLPVPPIGVFGGPAKLPDVAYC